MKKLATLVLVLLALALPAGAGAASGHLDPSFGSGGRAIAAIGPVSPYNALSGESAIGPDGRIYVLLLDQTLIAFGPSGELDAGFGLGGAISLPEPDGPLLGPVDVAVDPLGRIVVASTIVPEEPPDPEAGTDPSPERPYAVLVARYTAGGQPDASFGAGGRVVTRLGFPPAPIAAELGWGATKARKARVTNAGLAIDAAGRILLSGSSVASYGACADGRGYEVHRLAFLARLDGFGRPDPSFGANGVAVLGEGPVGAPAPDPRGGVFASVGAPTPLCADTPRRSAGFVSHLDAAGTAVAGFGRGGWRPLPDDPLATLLPDSRGGLVLMPGGGGWRNQLVFRRLRADGSWDRRFGSRGTATPFPSPRGSLHFTAAAMAPSGRIYATASWTRKPRGGGPKRRFVLFRLTPKGELDRGYGIVRTGFGKGTFAVSRQLLMSGGRPLALGPFQSPAMPGTEGIALARYLGG